MHNPFLTNQCRSNVTTDFNVVDEGTIFLLQPIKAAAQDWVDAHIPANARYFGSAVVIEHRFIEDILHGITNDGLTWAWR